MATAVDELVQELDAVVDAAYHSSKEPVIQAVEIVDFGFKVNRSYEAELCLQPGIYEVLLKCWGGRAVYCTGRQNRWPAKSRAE